jgi:hypothetical protein
LLAGVGAGGSGHNHQNGQQHHQPLSTVSSPLLQIGTPVVQIAADGGNDNNGGIDSNSNSNNNSSGDARKRATLIVPEDADSSNLDYHTTPSVPSSNNNSGSLIGDHAAVPVIPYDAQSSSSSLSESSSNNRLPASLSQVHSSIHTNGLSPTNQSMQQHSQQQHAPSSTIITPSGHRYNINKDTHTNINVTPTHRRSHTNGSGSYNDSKLQYHQWRGRNTFLCHGRVILGANPIWAMFTLVLILVPFAGWVYFVYVTLSTSSMLRKLIERMHSVQSIEVSLVGFVISISLPIDIRLLLRECSYNGSWHSATR